MKIAIIGSSSFLAHSLLKSKRSTEHQFILYNRNPELNQKRYDFPEFGVSKLDMHDLSLADVIIFTAGAGIQPGHLDDDSTINSLNYLEPKKLIERLNQIKFGGKLITFGSYFEIGISNEQNPYSEEKLISHQNSVPNVYCQSKRNLTKLASQRSLTNSFTHLHLILTNIYGKGENNHRLLPYLAESLSRGHDVSLSSGAQLRQYTHVQDICAIIYKLLHLELNSNIINCSSREILSVKTLIKRFARLGNYPNSKLKFETETKRDHAMNYLALDTQLLNQIISNHHFIPLNKGLIEYLNKS